MNYAELWQTVQDYTQNYENTFVTNIPVFVTQAEARIYNTVLLPALRKNVNGYTTATNKYVSCPDDFLSVFSIAITDASGNQQYLLNKDVSFMRESYPNANATGTPQYYSLFGPTIVNGAPTKELSFIVGPTPDGAYLIELHYFYYPISIVQGIISLLGTLTGGSGYTNGSYYRVPLTGGTGTNATADIVVSNGSITSVTLQGGGSFYTVGDVLTASTTVLGAGSGFSIPILSIINSSGSSWLGDNYSPVLLYGSLVEAYTFMKGEQDMMAYYEKKYQDALAQLIRLGAGLEQGDTYRDSQFKMKVAP